MRRKLPPVRPAINVKTWIGCDCEGEHDAASCGGTKIYLTVGLFVDVLPGGGVRQSPGEIFVAVAHECAGAFAGFADAWSVEVSVGLQSGRTVEELLRRYRGCHFEPCGRTTDPAIPKVKSIPDYVVRWLDRRFGNGSSIPLFAPPSQGPPGAPESDEEDRAADGPAEVLFSLEATAPPAEEAAPACPLPRARVCSCGVPLPDGKGVVCHNCGSEPDS